MSISEVTKDGVHNGRPPGEATTGVNVPGGPGTPDHPGADGRYQRRRRGEPTPTSYYGQPILNKPVWGAPDIPGYLFLGGLAGAGSVISAAAQLTARCRLARASKVANATAIGLSLVALVHDLGRRGRFLNMLRVFKVTSPMSVGSWLLAGFAPATMASAFCDVTGLLRPVGALATTGAAVLGPGVATYTAALISDTAVPAWHEGHRMMPFVFASSAAASAAGLGLVAAPVAETAPLKLLAGCAALGELALTKTMEERMGVVKEAYHQGKAQKLMRGSEVLLAAGAAIVLTSGRSRARRTVGGLSVLAGSALTRFGIFEAGVASAQDPKYTVGPQRERLKNRQDIAGAQPAPTQRLDATALPEAPLGGYQ
ncbi:MAG TPA: NrfD/PsrC family molybdoenzyme membrane anchor subunit [Acidimicrobiales bacterium]|nr:NrfD/PsrC family molybdoenzyme membrane anchor subunit [Acidimicrobiales bacterium]